MVGKYVRSLHAKDGCYPTNPRELGKETPIGEGKVDFPAVIRRLKELEFKGHITIEREISGPRQIEDILKSKEYLDFMNTQQEINFKIKEAFEKEGIEMAFPTQTVFIEKEK